MAWWRRGEWWGICGEGDGESVVGCGKFGEKRLGEVWEEDGDLFGDFEREGFGLLSKIVDGNDDLSVQVDPDDEYGNKFENGE
ncbi:type I phosphomannose isomerase catalytic subunit, partial [Priestia megaterium]|uniref:type I phosphomannose isomerase catalytic subunit n=1 Tax=Priestia megaterium TaxID=1404 RepID=UPI002E258E59